MDKQNSIHDQHDHLHVQVLCYLLKVISLIVCAQGHLINSSDYSVDVMSFFDLLVGRAVITVSKSTNTKRATVIIIRNYVTIITIRQNDATFS